MWAIFKTVFIIMASCCMLVSAVTLSSSAESKCLACSDRSAYKEMTKRTIKEEILRRLGFSSAPNVTGEYYSKIPFIQKQIRELQRYESEQGYQNDWLPGYQYQYDEDDYHFQPQTITIMPTKPPVYLGYPVLYFKLSERVIDSNRDLVKSLLNIHLPAAPSLTETHAIIHVYYLAQDKAGHSFLSPAKMNKVRLNTHSGGRVEINLTNLTRVWMKHPQENLGVVIKAHVGTDSQTELEVGKVGSEQGPYLQIDIQEGGWRSRVKRTTINRVCSEEYDPKVTQCCMWPLKIDFDEFNWDWILFPRSYDANFCSGDCSLGVPSEDPHTQLMQMSGSLGSAGPCCAPRKMSPINMIYLDKDANVVMGKLHNMKVTRCGCS